MRLQFDNLIFDSETRQVFVGGDEARLSPKAFELLSLLISRRPTAVRKSEIRTHLWPGTFVSESSLPSLVSEIRDAIADHRREPGLVRTVHGFGYAFQGQAVPIRDPLPAEPAGPGGWLIGPTGNLALSAGENIIGREGDGVGVVLAKSSTVSRRHARLGLHAAGALIEDLGSKNGTYVNDRRVSEPTAVAEGDQIRIGSLLFTLRLGQPSTSTETQSSTLRRRSHP